MSETIRNRAQLPKLHRNVLTAVLAALQIVMVLTGIAYVPIGPLRLTFLTLPIAVGGVLLGPTSGAILGAVFGASSFLTCIGVFSLDPFGAILFGLHPIRTFLMCVVPRILCGWLPALLCRGMEGRFGAQHTPSQAVACVCTPLFNTLLFTSALWAFFADDFVNDPKLIEYLGGRISSIGALFAALAGINAVLEAAVGLIIGTAVCKALTALLKNVR